MTGLSEVEIQISLVLKAILAKMPRIAKAGNGHKAIDPLADRIHRGPKVISSGVIINNAKDPEAIISNGAIINKDSDPETVHSMPEIEINRNGDSRMPKVHGVRDSLALEIGTNGSL